jgi:hypothetical protein
MIRVIRKFIRKRLDRIFVKRTLRRLLNDSRFEYRKLSTLRAATGLKTIPLFEKLNAVGARSAYRNQELWGSMARVGSTGRRSRR